MLDALVPALAEEPCVLGAVVLALAAWRAACTPDDDGGSTAAAADPVLRYRWADPLPDPGRAAAFAATPERKLIANTQIICGNNDKDYIGLRGAKSSLMKEMKIIYEHRSS